MGWSSTLRGRPREFVGDRTPLRGSRVDAAARIAWLLRVSRVAGPDHTTGEFTAALARHGCELGSSAVSRYETGAAPVPLGLIVAYERVLGLPAGQLLGVCLGVHRVFGPALATGHARPRRSREGLAGLLRVIEARIDAGTVTGMDWLTLAQALCRPVGVLLPPSVLRVWVAVLVSQTMRSVGPARTTRIQALSLLVGDPYSRRYVFEQIEHATSRPGAQGVIDVLAVLGDSTDPDILAWLIRHLHQDCGTRQQGVATALLTPIVRGTLPAGLVPALTGAILAAAGDGPERGVPAFWLAQRMSARLTGQVVATLGRYPAPVDEGARIQSPARLRTYLDAAGLASGLVDPMLERLLREGLSPDFIERRHHALLLLGASPYREVLAETALDLLAARGASWAADAAGTAITYLAGPTQQHRLLNLLAPAATGRPGQVLIALTRSGRVPDHVDLLDRAGDPEQGADAVYAAGMSAHPDLREMATSPALAGTTWQSSATWWLRTGPAITDPAPRRANGVPPLAGAATAAP